MTHVDAQQYRALLANPGRMGPELRAHLETGCETCAEAVARAEAVDPLDGRVDALLLADSRAPTAPPGELDAILAQVKTRRSFRVPVALAAGISVALIATAAVLRAPMKPAWTGEKGTASLSVGTSFAVVRPDGHVERGVRGAAYPQGSALAVRVQLERPLEVSLVRVGRDGSEVLLLNAPLPAGTQDLQKDGAPLGISLKGQVGTQHVSVIASERALSVKEAEAAARGEPVEGTVRAGFDVVVAP